MSLKGPVTVTAALCGPFAHGEVKRSLGAMNPNEGEIY